MFPYFMDLKKAQDNFEKNIENYKKFHMEQCLSPSRQQTERLNETDETDESNVFGNPEIEIHRSDSLKTFNPLNPENPIELCVMIKNRLLSKIVEKPLFTVVPRDLIIESLDKFIEAENLVKSPNNDIIELNNFLKSNLGFLIDHKATIRKPDLLRILINKM